MPGAERITGGRDRPIPTDMTEGEQYRESFGVNSLGYCAVLGKQLLSPDAITADMANLLNAKSFNKIGQNTIYRRWNSGRRQHESWNIQGGNNIGEKAVMVASLLAVLKSGSVGNLQDSFVELVDPFAVINQRSTQDPEKAFMRFRVKKTGDDMDIIPVQELSPSNGKTPRLRIIYRPGDEYLHFPELVNSADIGHGLAKYAWDRFQNPEAGDPHAGMRFDPNQAYFILVRVDNRGVSSDFSAIPFLYHGIFYNPRQETVVKDGRRVNIPGTRTTAGYDWTGHLYADALQYGNDPGRSQNLRQVFMDFRPGAPESIDMNLSSQVLAYL